MSHHRKLVVAPSRLNPLLLRGSFARAAPSPVHLKNPREDCFRSDPASNEHQINLGGGGGHVEFDFTGPHTSHIIDHVPFQK